MEREHIVQQFFHFSLLGSAFMGLLTIIPPCGKVNLLVIGSVPHHCLWVNSSYVRNEWDPLASLVPHLTHVQVT